MCSFLNLVKPTESFLKEDDFKKHLLEIKNIEAYEKDLPSEAFFDYDTILGYLEKELEDIESHYKMSFGGQLFFGTTTPLFKEVFSKRFKDTKFSLAA